VESVAAQGGGSDVMRMVNGSLWICLGLKLSIRPQLTNGIDIKRRKFCIQPPKCLEQEW